MMVIFLAFKCFFLATNVINQLLVISDRKLMTFLVKNHYSQYVRFYITQR